MKKLITNSNPFALLILPVLFAMVIGVGYQVKQKSIAIQTPAYTQTQATSLFYKGVTLFKAVCAIKNENVW